MAKLHHCDDGMPVTEKVILYKSSRSNDVFVSIHKYYDNFKDRWHSELRDFLDRSTFDSEFDFKLCRAIESFDEEQARALCEKYKWSFLGAFNRWFYAVLRNWKSNVKTNAFRQKKRPPVQCPACGRYVPRIDEIHLAHYKTKSDLPKALSWKGNVYGVMSSPDVLVISWGKYSKRKLTEINSGKTTNYRRERIEWPWYTKEGTRGVMCPFTKKIVPELNAEYIQTLPNRFSRYADPLTWQEFVEEYPYPVLIQAEIFSLDYNVADEDISLLNKIAVGPHTVPIGHEDIEANNISAEYEHVFYLIEQHIEEELDQKILKLAAIGYTDDDIASVMDIDRREVKKRKKEIRSTSGDLRQMLIESV